VQGDREVCLSSKQDLLFHTGKLILEVYQEALEFHLPQQRFICLEPGPGLLSDRLPLSDVPVHFAALLDCPLT